MKLSGPSLLALLLFNCAGAPAQSHWPLEVGNRWELVSSLVKTPMIFEVTGQTNGVFQVKWSNPWVPAQFGFQPAGQKIFLATLDMGAGSAPMPSGTVYFDFASNKGARWKNSIGDISVPSKGESLDTPAGRFRNCIEIEARDAKGNPTIWTFAPGVGPVRFGRGNGEFLLTKYHLRGAGLKGGPKQSALPPPAPARFSNSFAPQSPATGGRPTTGAPTLPPSGFFLGLDANPTPAQDYSPQSKLDRSREAKQMGASYLYCPPKWSDVEYKPNQFDYSDLDLRIGLADANNFPVSLNLRVVDTGNRAMPSDLAGLPFSDPRVSARLQTLIHNIGPRTHGRVQWLTIGAEVNEYFLTRPNEVADYASLISSVRGALQQEFPGIPVSVNYTWTGAPLIDTQFASLTAQSDFLSFTYYPLNPDYTMRDPNLVVADMTTMINAAKKRPLMFQEIGYASAASLNSSEVNQARFLSNVFAVLKLTPGLLAANIVWLSDVPDSALDDLGQYYGLTANQNFRDFLATLGYIDKNSRPKLAYRVLKTQMLKTSLGQE